MRAHLSHNKTERRTEKQPERKHLVGRLKMAIEASVQDGYSGGWVSFTNSVIPIFHHIRRIYSLGRSLCIAIK